MLLGPVMGFFIALIACAASAFVWLFPTSAFAVDLLAGAAVVTTFAIVTRALHLDGLADTADGLGSAKVGDAALAVMKKSDIGPFGVVTLILVLLIQVVAVASIIHAHAGFVIVISAAVVGRLCAMAATARGWPAARSDGLGAAVIGSVPRSAAITEFTLISAFVVACAAFIGWRAVVATAIAIVVSLAITLGLSGLAIKRFGGLTGDTLGAIVEVTTTCVLVAGALAVSAQVVTR
jgi:adenosylcobinamide-GDP ribazoletransferase